MKIKLLWFILILAIVAGVSAWITNYFDDKSWKADIAANKIDNYNCMYQPSA